MVKYYVFLYTINERIRGQWTHVRRRILYTGLDDGCVTEFTAVAAGAHGRPIVAAADAYVLGILVGRFWFFFSFFSPSEARCSALRIYFIHV